MDAEICALAPSHWQIRTVEDVCKRVTSGGTPSRTRPDFYVDGTWPWVKTQELQDTWIDHTEETITNEAVANSSAKVLPENTILLAMYGATVGQLGILRIPMTCNQACCALIVDSEKADFRYLYYNLRYSRAQLKSLATGAAQQNLSGALIKSLRYPFPPLPTQRAIAHVLGTLDDLIELNRETNELLEEMARALFKSWFVDFDPVRAKLEGRQPSGMDAETAKLFPDHFQDSELGQIPKGWEVRSIGEVVDCVGGGTPSTSEPGYWENGTIHWTSPKDLSNLSFPFLTKTDRRITEAGLARISSGLLPAGTLLMSSRAPVGYLAIAEIPVAINQGYIAMKPNEIASNYYLLNWCHYNMAEIENRASGTTFAEISKSAFRPISILLPSVDIMNAFTKCVEPFYAQIVSNLHESRDLATVRDTLLPKLLSGEIAVPSSC